jgi:serine/threonine protein kinase
LRYGGDPQTLAGVRQGEVLAGKYRVDRVLGIGGMGVVVAAKHMQLGEPVAIKLLLPQMTADPEAVNRFAREALAAVRIKGEHVARVFDVGTLETGAPYIVMEFLEGVDLACWIRDRGPSPIDLAVDFVLQACLAVAEAHRLGIVHRDLKPSNLFCVRGIDGRPFIKVLDFGISKMTTFNTHGPKVRTMTSAIMGSPLYMSPEQMQSTKDVDSRTDIWALGVVLYELVTGRAPFKGQTTAELIIEIATKEPPSLREVRPDAPEGLEDVVKKCFAKDRESRYGDVGELARALGPFAPHEVRPVVEQIVAIVGGPSPPSVAAPEPMRLNPNGTVTNVTVGRTLRDEHVAKRPIVLAGVGLAVSVGACALAIAIARGHHHPKSGELPPATSHAPDAQLPSSVAPVVIMDSPHVVESTQGVRTTTPVNPLAATAVAAPSRTSNHPAKPVALNSVPIDASTPQPNVPAAAAVPAYNPLFDLKPK